VCDLCGLANKRNGTIARGFGRLRGRFSGH
jgi:hypothetical protein